MSASTLQQRANQRNARQSTGPRTDQGKQRSSQNALSLGIYAKSPVLPGEDPLPWQKFRDAMLARLDPRDMLELQFAEQVILASWNLNRLATAEKRIIELRIEQDFQQRHDLRRQQLEPLLVKANMYQRLLQRRENAEWRGKLDEATRSIEELQSQFNADPVVPLSREEVLARLLNECDPALERVYRHQQRLENSMHRALQRLEKLQRNSICEPDDFAKQQMSRNEPKTAVAVSEMRSDEELERTADEPEGLEEADNEPFDQPARLATS